MEWEYKSDNPLCPKKLAEQWAKERESEESYMIRGLLCEAFFEKEREQVRQQIIDYLIRLNNGLN